MELRHLRYFVAVAETLHFGRAARQLHVSQPSLSEAIRQLETELQATLLERTKRNVALSDAGRFFLDEARQILARADHASLVARRLGPHGATRVRVSTGYCVDQSLVARIVGEFNRRRKTARVEVQTMSVPHQLSGLREDRLDIAFVRAPDVDAPLRAELLMEEPLVAALPKEHRLATRQRVSLSGLANEEFVLVPADAVPVYHSLVLAACRQAGFVPNAPHEADHLHMMLGMVAAGIGVSLVPESAQRAGVRGVVFRPLDVPATLLQTVIAWRRDAAVPVHEFVEIARTIAAAPRPRRQQPMPRATPGGKRAT